MSGNWRSDRINRRTFVKRGAGLVISLGGAAGLLGACTQAPGAPTQAPASPTQAPATKPTAAPAPASAPTAAPASSAIKRGGILRDVFSILNPGTLDRHLLDSGSHADPHLLYDALLHRALVDREKGTYEIRPHLAESYRVVDPTLMEFKLRRGVKFHDGTNFNAAVAAWNIERAGSHPKSTVKSLVAVVSRVEVVDEYTMRLHLKKPSGVLPLFLSDGGAAPPLSMVSREAVEKLGDEAFGRNPVGTGPMKFKEWVKDTRIVLEKFPGHWQQGLDGQPLPYLDGLVMRWITDSAAIMMELKAGTVDSYRQPDVADLPAVRADPNLDAVPMPGMWKSYPAMYFNPRPGTNLPFSNNLKLRQAAQHAIDREGMAKALGAGIGRPDYHPFFYPGMPGYDESLPKYEYNLAKAKQLIAEAGYANGVDLEVKVPNRPLNVRAVEVLQAMYAQAGIRVKIAVLDRAVWIEDGRAGKFEALAHDWNAYPDTLSAPYTRTGGSNNWSGYSNPEVDKLYDQAEAEYDEAKRAEIYKKMHRVQQGDAYFISGFMLPTLTFVNRRVRDMTTYINYRHVWLG